MMTYLQHVTPESAFVARNEILLNLSRRITGKKKLAVAVRQPRDD